MEIASIQTSTINQADNYFAYPRSSIGVNRFYVGVGLGIGRMLVACYRRREASCVEIYVFEES